LKVLALDLATQLGWALKTGDTKPKYGTEKLHNTELDGAGYRFIKFYRFLEDHVDCDLIVYEAVQFASSTRASQLYGGWLSTLQIFCENHHIPYTGYNVKTVKKHWTGRGSASKKEMVDTARSKGFNPKTEDEADALAILHLALSEVTSGEAGLLRSMRCD